MRAGSVIPVSSFVDYVALYATGEDTARVWERVNDRWEVCLTGADGTFGQVRRRVGG